MLNLDGLSRCRKRDKMDRKRQLRLLQKIQKARALESRDEVLSQPSWNKRFRRVIKLRAAA